MAARIFPSDLSFQDRLQDMPVAMGFVFVAMAQQSHRLALGQLLEKSQGKLLPVVLDRPISLVNRSAFEQFLAVPAAELAPTHPARKHLVQRLLARSEVRHPHVVSGCGHPATTKPGREDSQSILARFNRRED